MNTTNNNSTKKLTPRTLVRKQIADKDFHVSEEDMRNLDTSIEPVASKTGDVPEDNGQVTSGTPYDIIGE